MSRASLRIKNNQPIATDVNSKTLSMIFGLSSATELDGEQGRLENRQTSNEDGVLLTNYRRSLSEDGCQRGQGSVESPSHGELVESNARNRGFLQSINNKINTSEMVGHLETDLIDTKPRRKSVFSKSEWSYNINDKQEQLSNVSTVLSSTLKENATADFESAFITDEESHPDDSGAESSSLDLSSNGGQVDGTSRSNIIRSSKFIRAKFRDSKSWGKIKSLSESREVGGINSVSSNNNNNVAASAENVDASQLSATEGKLSRLFFARKSTVGSPPPPPFEIKSTPKVAEEEEKMLGGATNPATVGREKPPQLAIAPPGLGQEQLKRRHIIDSLVRSENNYVSSLQRLLNDYKTPLEECSSPILSANKVQLLFHRVAEILQCHTLFRIALSDAINNWDRDEAIGDVFVATFSKAVVLEIYSEFINNFTAAMELARHESKRKSALADFLKIRQIEAHDRVSFFGLMVKPVQRFPQFILLLQDLLKETPPGHPDRMALQLALTTLESLAEMLNERKREAEQYAAFRDKMRSISGGKFSSSGTRASALFSSDHQHLGVDHHSSFQSLTPSSSKLYSDIPAGANHNSLPSGVGSLHCHQGGTPLRFLLREDNMTQLEFNSFGLIARSKHRRLLLLNDFLVCVSVNGRSLSDLEPPNSSAISNERLTLKWAVPVRDVELVDGNSGGTLARMLFSTLNCNGGSESSGGTRKRTLTRTLTPSALLSGVESGSSVSILASSQRVSGRQGVAEDLAQDMNDLMHDYDVVSKISHLIGTLKGDHEGLNTEVTSRITHEIQRSIRQKDEEMFWADASCLQFTIRGRGSKDKLESFTFQCKDPNVKKEWIVELRLAQLALDPNNSPGWDVLEQERNLSTKMPLFVKSYCGYRSTKNRQSEISCGTSYTIFIQTATRALRPQTYVWFAAHDGVCSHLRIFGMTQHQPGLKEMGTVTAPDQSTINCLQYVPGLHGGVATNDPEPLRGDLVWVGFDAKQIIIYSAMDPDRGTVLGTIGLASEVVCMKYHLDTLWVGLANGSMAIFRRNSFSLSWQIKFPQLVLLGDAPVTALLPVTNAGIYAACGQRVWVVDAITKEQLKSFVVQSKSSQDLPVQATSQVQQMAQSGVGLWISLKNSATICLYHTETFRHLQDINIASNVSRVLAARDVTQPQRSIHVTALMASRGLLWVGTNVGIALTVPLPRLEGVPIISGRANISYHAHYGAVTFFLNVHHRIKSAEPPELHHNDNTYDSMIMEESEQELQSEEGDTESLTCFNKDSGCLSGSNPSFDGKPKAAMDPRKTTKLAHRNDCSLPRARPRIKQCGDCDFDNQKRFSKTLPRGFSLTNSECTNNELTDVYGLYGDLLNVKEYSYVDGRDERHHGGTSEGMGGIGGSAGEESRKSDPEISTIQYRVSTLDRRMRMKSSRPKSLDMSSTWSMESRSSSSGGQTTTSSSEAGSARPSPCVSRNDSFQSHSSVATSSNSESAGVAGLLTCPVANSVPTPPLPKPPEKSEIPKLEPPKTITTLMGGRGYINWRRASMEKQRTAALAQINNSDAFLVIWEMKI